MEIRIIDDLLVSVDNKRPYLIDGSHLKNGKYRELITFKDGSKVRVIYGWRIFNLG